MTCSRKSPPLKTKSWKTLQQVKYERALKDFFFLNTHHLELWYFPKCFILLYWVGRIHASQNADRGQRTAFPSCSSNLWFLGMEVRSSDLVASAFWAVSLPLLLEASSNLQHHLTYEGLHTSSIFAVNLTLAKSEASAVKELIVVQGTTYLIIWPPKVDKS